MKQFHFHLEKLNHNGILDYQAKPTSKVPSIDTLHPPLLYSPCEFQSILTPLFMISSKSLSPPKFPIYIFKAIMLPCNVLKCHYHNHHIKSSIKYNILTILHFCFAYRSLKHTITHYTTRQQWPTIQNTRNMISIGH
jgi:hypothetical protein